MPDSDVPPAVRSFKIPTFTPLQAEIWVDMVEDAFVIHGITDKKQRMVEIRMALTQEFRALTAHIHAPGVSDAYDKLVAYLRKYGVKTEVKKMRAMVAKCPMGNSTPTAHLQALKIEFGTAAETMPMLRRIFEDSLSPNIASLLAAERITDIDTYAERADELYILYRPARDEMIIDASSVQPAVVSVTASAVNSEPEVLSASKGITDKIDLLA